MKNVSQWYNRVREWPVILLTWPKFNRLCHQRDYARLVHTHAHSFSVHSSCDLWCFVTSRYDALAARFDMLISSVFLTFPSKHIDSMENKIFLIWIFLHARLTRHWSLVFSSLSLFVLSRSLNARKKNSESERISSRFIEKNFTNACISLEDHALWWLQK